MVIGETKLCEPLHQYEATVPKMVHCCEALDTVKMVTSAGQRLVLYLYWKDQIQVDDETVSQNVRGITAAIIAILLSKCYIVKRDHFKTESTALLVVD